MPAMTNEHKESLRQAALKRHAERKAAVADTPPPSSYIAPPNPPALDPAAPPVVTPEPVPVPVTVTTPLLVPNPALSAPVPPRESFAAWLRGHEGVAASDTRMSKDSMRFAAELEDRLWIAWQAGYQTGRDGV